jgi:hypothetical protein
MQYPMKKPTILFAAILFAGLMFAGPARLNSPTQTLVLSAYSPEYIPTDPASANSSLKDLYNVLNLEKAGLNEDIFLKAMNGMKKLENEGLIKNADLITIADFSQPSSQKRLYVINLKTREILFNSLVAHGRNSGTLYAKSFSNEASSLKSSPGFYSTGETYEGNNGFSLRLDGLEKNINDNARARAVVMHGAPYVDEQHVHSMGFIGRSWGCPAVPVELHKAIINTIKGGSCLFIYSPDATYQQQSNLLNS